jgi:hypothetical protein
MTSWLYLQRIYSDNSPQDCGATMVTRCARRTAFAEGHHPLPAPSPTADPFRTRYRLKYAM